MSEKNNRIEQVKNKFPNVNINDILTMDPSKNKKYALWIARQVNDGFKVEDIRPTVLSFVKNGQRLPKKDIYAYENLKSLEDALKDLPQSKRAMSKFKKENGAEHLGSVDNYKVVYVFEKAGAVFFGAGTRWCITQADAEYFNDYSESNNHFYFLLREGAEEGTNAEKDPLYKVAVVLKKKELPAPTATATATATNTDVAKKKKVKSTPEFELEIYNAQDHRVEKNIIDGTVEDKKLLATLQKCVELCKKDVVKRRDTLAYRFSKDLDINDAELLSNFVNNFPEVSKELMEFMEENAAYVERVKTEYSKITPEEHKYIHDFVPKNKKRLVLAIHQLGFNKFKESDIQG